MKLTLSILGTLMLSLSLSASPDANSGTLNTTLTGCAGTYLDPGGTGNYSAGANTTVTYCSGSSDFLFFDFDNAVTQFGAGDVLTAYDGPSTSSPIIGVYLTGSNINDFTSSGTCVTFVWRSDANTGTVGRGWSATYSCTSVRPRYDIWLSSGERYTCDARIFDPGGPTGSSGHGVFTQTYGSVSGLSRVRMSFSAFDIATGHQLAIYDGPDATFPLIGSYNNNNPLGVVQSTGGFLTFVLNVSNTNWTVRSGFAADMTCTSPILPVHNLSNGTTTTSCGGVFYDHAGANASYGNNRNEVHTFCSDNGQNLFFDFNNLQTAFGVGDVLTAFDGPSTSSPLIGTYQAGSNIDDFTSSGTCVTFRFVSDNADVARGWQSLFTCTPLAQPMAISMSSGTRYA